MHAAYDMSNIYWVEHDKSVSITNMRGNYDERLMIGQADAVTPKCSLCQPFPDDLACLAPRDIIEGYQVTHI